MATLIVATSFTYLPPDKSGTTRSQDESDDEEALIPVIRLDDETWSSRSIYPDIACYNNTYFISWLDGVLVNISDEPNTTDVYLNSRIVLARVYNGTMIDRIIVYANPVTDKSPPRIVVNEQGYFILMVEIAEQDSWISLMYSQDGEDFEYYRLVTGLGTPSRLDIDVTDDSESRIHIVFPGLNVSSGEGGGGKAYYFNFSVNEIFKLHHPIKLEPLNIDDISIDTRIEIVNGDIYVCWSRWVNGDNATYHIFFTMKENSTNGFADPVQVEDIWTGRYNHEPLLATLRNKVQIIWEASGIHTSTSYDKGQSFSEPKEQLYSWDTHFLEFHIAQSDNHIYQILNPMHHTGSTMCILDDDLNTINEISLNESTLAISDCEQFNQRIFAENDRVIILFCQSEERTGTFFDFHPSSIMFLSLLHDTIY